MTERTSCGWWSRHFWKIVVCPVLAALLLALVEEFKGWLTQWIGSSPEVRPLTRGGANAAAAKSRTVIADAVAYQRIVEDLKRRDVEARSRLRYLTLMHRHNEPACTEDQLEAERRAVRDLVDLLAQGRPAHLEFIDAEQLIARIDLEQFGWAAATDWHQVVSHYRYGLGPVGDDALAQLQLQVEQLTQETIPVVRADWFVAALNRPALAGPKGLSRKSSDELPETVRTVGRQYSAQTLDLAACARELGLGDEKVLVDLLRRQESLQQEFCLAPLLRGERIRREWWESDRVWSAPWPTLRKGERIRREWWESDRHFFSPYQELARLLKIGKPVRVQ